MVFTGANRERGTWIARAPGIEPIAAPIADSSWITGVLAGSALSCISAASIACRPHQ